VELPSWASDVDLTRPSAARVYDYLLGGSHNYGVDREMARQLLEFYPDLRRIARSNRSFLRRAVQYLLAAGIDQFLDIGSGIPTVGNVHEIAQRANPAARVAYVDLDPISVSHSRAILAGNDRAVAVRADLRDPDSVLGHPEVSGLFDRTRPVAILMVAVLHFVPDADDPAGAVARFAGAVAEGSYLAISHAMRYDQAPPTPGGREVMALYARNSAAVTTRSPDELALFFDGFELVEPGIVPVPLWQPESPTAVETDPDRLRREFYAGVGRKTGPGPR
jgi:hypothetical protein